MPGKETADAIFIVRRMQEEYQTKDKKLYMCFVDMKKALDRVPRKVMVRAVMSLYGGAKIRVRVSRICIFRGIRSKTWCSSRICAVATIVCNSCERYYKKCKKGCG